MNKTTHRIATDKDGMNIDMMAVLLTSHWLIVLAAPHVYGLLQRVAEPAHLARLLDIWIAYTDRGDHYLSATPGEDRPMLARALSARIAGWTPPDLPGEITEAARAILHAEGAVPLQAKTDGWDSYQWDLGDGSSLDSSLSWSETEIMLNEATAAEVEAANVERKNLISKWLKDMKISGHGTE
jgi:hypothetical protein